MGGGGGGGVGLAGPERKRGENEGKWNLGEGGVVSVHPV